MSEADDLLTLTPSRQASRDGQEETIAPGAVFAVTTGGRLAQALQFIRPDGCSFSVPYSYAPLLWWHPPGTILLEYPGLFSVILQGDDLAELHRRILDRKVVWVRACEPEQAKHPSAVTRLAILRAFPSREGDDGISGFTGGH
jgi:hypothetical protein